MKIIQNSESKIKEIIREAVEVLRNGGVVIYPTETCYGIGADATNQQAVDKALKYKARREGKPFSVAVSGEEMASEYVEINEIARNLYKNFLPGPLTVVSKSLGKVAKGVESEQNTLGIRLPDYPLVLGIVEALGHPITSSSANASYKKRPYCIQDILDNISQKQKDLIDLVIDAGTLPKNDPSTVVDTTLNQNTVLRQGTLKISGKREYVSSSPQETREIGSDLLNMYRQYLGYKSLIFAMKGELGAGKTEMTKGIAEALKIQEKVSSPTYVIENTYKIPATKDSYLETRKTALHHIDVWRLYESNELEELNFFGEVDKANVFVIEWADKVTDVLEKVKDEAIILWVDIELGDGDSDRIIRVWDFG